MMMRTTREAVATLGALTTRPAHRFLPDDVGFVDNAQVPHDRLVGHRQVTDAHLLGLARRHQATLVTFDNGLAALGGDTVQLLVSDGFVRSVRSEERSRPHPDAHLPRPERGEGGPEGPPSHETDPGTGTVSRAP
jgi:hypothetical protein